MSIHPLAGKLAPKEVLVNVPRLVSAYYLNKPDPNIPAQAVSFGTSGHRGSSNLYSFNEDHVLAISQASLSIVKTRAFPGALHGHGHACLVEPALYSAIEVFAANGMEINIHKTIITPPVISMPY